MFVLVITGGIAMGKSTVVDALRGSWPGLPVFDADAAVAELLTTPEIAAKIATEFGDPALTGDGQVNRPFLREQVFDSAERRAALENILHPEVRTRFDEAKANTLRSGARSLVADIPLFFEARTPYPADAVAVVATDRETQFARLVSRPGISPEMASKIIDSQLPIDQKMARADVVVWNAGSRDHLQSQSDFLSTWLKKKTS